MQVFKASIVSFRSYATKSLPKRLPIAGVEKILLVAAGKGGVGKSTVAGRCMSMGFFR